MPVTKHLLVINTHNRLGTFGQLLSHVQSFDDLFEEILIICDSDDQYFASIKNLVDLFSVGSNKYKLIQLKCVGGAEARNYIIRNDYVFKFDFVSFCDDDDLPFRVKFESAKKILLKEKDIVGYSASYIRNYGKISREIISKNKYINFDELIKNNDLGGFSFVTLKTIYLKEINLIPVDLNSNQDWYLWMSILYKHKKFSFFKDMEVGLVYDDDRRKKARLTLNSSNIASTYAFYKYCKNHFNHDNENVLGYFYFKYLRQMGLFDLIKSPLLKNPYLNKKHIISLIKINFIERLFL